MHVFLHYQSWVPLAPRYWHTACCYRPPGSRAVQLLVFGGNLPAYTVRLGDMMKCPTTGLRKWRGDFRILQWGEPKACGYVDVGISMCTCAFTLARKIHKNCRRFGDLWLMKVAKGYQNV